MTTPTNPTGRTACTLPRSRRVARWLVRETDPGDLAGLAAAVLAGLLTAVLRGDTQAGLLAAVAVVGAYTVLCHAHDAAAARLGLDRCDACAHPDSEREVETR